ncbi:MAG: toll/interleukin-1 receptor domain-containing protein [Bacteroidota bacterium]
MSQSKLDNLKLRPKIFISYRRLDSVATTGRLYDYLKGRFGKEAIFQDFENIKIGEKFTKIIEEAIQNCHVFVLMIGPHFFSIKDSQGKIRITKADDYVRLEIESALKYEKTIIPIFIDHASIENNSKHTPKSISEVLTINGCTLTHEKWSLEAKIIIDRIKQIIKKENDKTFNEHESVEIKSISNNRSRNIENSTLLERSEENHSAICISRDEDIPLAKWFGKNFYV